MSIVKFKTSWNISLGVPKIKDFLHPNFCFATIPYANILNPISPPSSQERSNYNGR